MVKMLWEDLKNVFFNLQSKYFISVPLVRPLLRALNLPSRRTANCRIYKSGANKFAGCSTSPPKFLRTWYRYSRCAWSIWWVISWLILVPRRTRKNSIRSLLPCTLSRHATLKRCVWQKSKLWMKTCKRNVLLRKYKIFIFIFHLFWSKLSLRCFQHESLLKFTFHTSKANLESELWEHLIWWSEIYPIAFLKYIFLLGSTSKNKQAIAYELSIQTLT